MNRQEKNLIRENINFLASDKYTAFTDTVPQSKGEVIGDKKIVKAGTILPANDGSAKGILLEDVDVTNGDAIGSLVKQGFVLSDRLPEFPNSSAMESLKLIDFNPNVEML